MPITMRILSLIALLFTTSASFAAPIRHYPCSMTELTAGQMLYGGRYDIQIDPRAETATLTSTGVYPGAQAKVIAVLERTPEGSLRFEAESSGNSRISFTLTDDQEMAGTLIMGDTRTPQVFSCKRAI